MEPIAAPGGSRPARRYHIQTFGCQMNEYDSARIAEVLARAGYEPAGSAESASLIIINTCAVREKPEQKVLSMLGRYREQRESKGTRLAVAGCVAQQRKAELLKRVPYLDLVFGPDMIARLPEMLERIDEGERVCQTTFADRHSYQFPAADPESVRGQVSALVTVMKGCNNVCSFCVVPRTRGREQSRPVDQVLAEVRGMVEAGVREVTLIGQNVNSYAGGVSFAELLRRVCAVDGLWRVRFTTSHPTDLSDELIEVFGELPSLTPQFHLPVQSGSDRILERMRRGYTAADYLRRVARLRQVRPGIALTTDIIAGFPGETEDDFELTFQLCEQVRYENIYSFVYSPRPGTAAMLHEEEWGAVPYEEKVRRLEHLQARAREVSLEYARALVGRRVEVLVEGPSKTDASRLFGRTPESRTVNYEGTSPAGSLVEVEITSATPNAVFGVERARLR
ncbi:MAG TPA: tRNA (N6-isopentenyl adenosine(37)-C2)-methylthiotransferase MiaB [Myxococcales bacterium]|nr:tRNA (N6-isopentenyl adenosine(37)-C2)-methylthiotransferase MiaB [Myxococcales bacterium]